VPELTDIVFSPTDTTAELAEKMARLTAQMRERMRVGELRVGDTTKLDYNGDATFADVTLTGLTMATGATVDYVMTCDADGVASWATAGVTGAAGSDTEVQYNDSGSFGASPTLVFDVGAKALRTRAFTAVDSTGLKLYNASDQGIRIDDAYGHVGINCDPGSGSDLDINGDTIRLRSSKVPMTANASGKAGMFSWGNGYWYMCVATDTWQRASLATW